MSVPSCAELSEAVVTDGFHSLLKASLAQARAEALLDDDELERSGQDVMIAAPALALYFAALQARGEGIAMPDGSFTLSARNCPSSLRPYYDVWESCVVPIQSLPLEARHDLALVLCDKPAASSPLRADVVKLKADLQLVAMEINLRASFQARFGGDLQHALDSGVRPRTSGESARSAQYEPPPGYEAAKEFDKSPHTLQSQPHTHPVDVKRPPVPSPTPSAAAPPRRLPPRLPSRPTSSHSRTSSAASGTASSSAPHPPDTLTLIRETLFSALGDSLATQPVLAALVVRGQQEASFASRAYFAALSLAVLDVALYRVDVAPASQARQAPDSTLLDSVRVRAVQVGAAHAPIVDAASCPPHLRPLLGALAGIARHAQALAQRDDERAMRDAERGSETPEGVGAIARLRKRLIGSDGLNQVPGSPNAAADEHAIAGVALAIQKLGMGMFAITDFGTRLAEALKVLAAIHTL